MKVHNVPLKNDFHFLTRRELRRAEIFVLARRANIIYLQLVNFLLNTKIALNCAERNNYGNKLHFTSLQ